MAARKKDSWTGEERRRYGRVQAQIALQLSGTDEAFPAESITTESLNIGAGGVYCHVGHFIAPLTKMQVTMVLPLRTKKGTIKNEIVKTDGVVVRCQPSGGEEGGYQIACFFTALDEENRIVLEEYVKQHASV